MYRWTRSVSAFAFAIFAACASLNPATARAAVVQAIEYYHVTFDHYFITASPEEIAKLDAGEFQGWQRTGQSFNVYASEGAPAGTQPVCRFFSTAFTPSSHFYTSIAAECAGVMHNPAWQFEGQVFNVIAPDSRWESFCAPDSTPVYRHYNGGRGGAPNHRYTALLGLALNMRALGWCSEGYGTRLDPRNPTCDPLLPPPESPLGVVFCSPR